MSLLWVEGFETDQNASTWDRKYFGGEDSNGAASFVDGRFGGLAARATDNFLRVSTTTLGYKQTLTCGIAYRCNAPKDNTAFLIFQGQGAVQPMKIVQRQVSGSVQFELISKGSTAYTSPSFDYDKWLYLELWCIFETPATQKNTIFSVNGTEMFIGSVNNGVNSVSPGYTQFSVYGESDPGGYVDLDDFYILDHALPGPTYFLDTGYGTVVEAMLPESPGTNAEWTPNTGANYAAVDDASTGVVDDDTTYVEGDSATDLDLHELSDLRFINGKIHGIEATIDARGVSGSADVDHLIQTGVYGPQELVTATFSGSWGPGSRARTVHTTNPSTGGLFTPTDLRNSRIGYGAKENFVIDGQIDPPEPPEEDFDYGTTAFPSGTEADFGTTSSPSGPDADFGTV